MVLTLLKLVLGGVSVLYFNIEWGIDSLNSFIYFQENWSNVKLF